MAQELSTLGVTLGWASEATLNVRPTSGYTPIPGIKSVPDMNSEPQGIDVTPLEETQYRRYVPGLRDMGGSLAFTANLNSTFETAWGNAVTAFGNLTDGKGMWWEVRVPGFKSFYFRGEPNALGMSAMDVNSPLEVDAYITPNKVHGWDTHSTTSG